MPPHARKKRCNGRMVNSVYQHCINTNAESKMTETAMQKAKIDRATMPTSCQKNIMFCFVCDDK